MKKIACLVITVFCFIAFSPTKIFAAGADDLVLIFNTQATEATVTNRIIIPLKPGSTADLVYTEIGNPSNTGTVASISGIYTLNVSPGTYEVRLTPTSNPFSVNFGYLYQNYTAQNENAKLVTLSQWGTATWGDMSYSFAHLPNFDVTATDVPNVANVKNFTQMFASNYSLVGTAAFANWNTSSATSFNAMFSGASLFNQPIGNWYTGSVTNMSSMFRAAYSFNQPIGNWNTGNVLDISDMFSNAVAFNQDISSWNTAKVTNMKNTFLQANLFNQPIGSWNTSSVTNMSGTFSGAWDFNQPIGNWNTANVTDMSEMFVNTISFNQSINNWNTAKVTNMAQMFAQAYDFNQPLNDWNVSNVLNMSSMFQNTYSFNQPLDKWNVSKVNDMSNMFFYAHAFDQNLGMWNMASIPSGSTTAFDRMLEGSAISCNHYAQILLGWTNTTYGSGWAVNKTGITLGAANLNYASQAQTAHDYLTGTNSWSITDAGTGTCILPVTFGKIEAIIKGNELTLNWQTVTESNNKHFNIEVSNDGINFKTLATVKSKAVDGNSNITLNYDYISDLSVVNLLAVPAFLALFFAGFSRRQKMGLMALLLSGMLIFNFSCSKNDKPIETKAENVFVRIAQVDKDGTTNYSKIIKATKN